jgi:hypothetical protein
MYRTFKVLKDTYVTDRIISHVSQTNANVGNAGSLDLFKIYGNSTFEGVPLTELSRILVQFDLSTLKSDVASGRVDLGNPSFNCTLNLTDVYYGQPTPANFVVKVYPLSQSFDEGLGRDIVFFQDRDVANWLTASYSGGAVPWFSPGADTKGALGSPGIDVILNGNLGAGTVNLWVTQSFPKGTENLQVDVTQVVSATLAGLVPDCGFRVSFTETIEDDQRTYFVKRFGSSQAVDPYVQPKLIFRYNDSVVSNESNLTFDAAGTLFLYNYVRGNLTNVVSGTSLTPVVGQNCMALRLSTPVSTSSGFTSYETYVTASQHRVGSTYVTGVYSASVLLLSAVPQFATKIRQSGSVTFDQVWTSFDNTVSYFSGSVAVTPPASSTGPVSPRRYFLNVTNVASEYLADDTARMKVFVFDYSSPVVMLVKVPLETPSVVVESAYYSIRDVSNDTVVIPFDTTYGSTKLSADSQTMYFDLWMSSLVSGRAYTVDILLVEGGQHQVYRDVSPPFRVV